MPTKKRPKKYWVHKVKTVSTYPPSGIFTKDAPTIARTMASKKVSPKGIGSGIRMIQYFLNRGGKGLSPTRRRELERAKKMLQARAHKQRCACVTETSVTEKITKGDRNGSFDDSVDCSDTRFLGRLGLRVLLRRANACRAIPLVNLLGILALILIVALIVLLATGWRFGLQVAPPP